MNLRWFCYDDEDVGDETIHTKSLKWRSEQIIDYVEQIATKSVISVLEMDEAELALRVLTAEINLPKQSNLRWKYALSEAAKARYRAKPYISVKMRPLPQFGPLPFGLLQN